MNDLFKKYQVNIAKLLEYGFTKDNELYKYQTDIDNEFVLDVTIDNDKVLVSIIDKETNEEYIGIKIKENNGEFVNYLRRKGEEILLDIRSNCFDREYFIYPQARRIAKYIIQKYNAFPEFLWEKYDDYGVFRRCDNNKWFGIIMNIDKSKIMNDTGEVEILDIRVDNLSILNEKGFYKAYHMNKKNWITIILDDTIEDKLIEELIDKSYELVK